MPKYDYHCTRCGKELEAEQRMSDPPLVKCPNCGADALERLVSKTSFTLKGGGWYADGYGSGGSSTSKSESGASPAKSETKTETKSETKTEAKPETKTETKTETKKAD